MEYLISFLFFLLCLGLIWRMTRARDVVDFQLGVIATFSIGYYCLPIWFRELSPLRWHTPSEVAAVALIFFLFLLFVVLGTWMGRRIVPRRVALVLPGLDPTLYRNMRIITIAAFLFYLYHYSTQTLTSYSAENFEAFFTERGPLHSLLALIAASALAWIAIAIAQAWKGGRRSDLILYSAMFAFCLLLLLLVGQRLALLTPLAMLAAALAITGQPRRAVSMLGVMVLVLLIVSPIAVFIRESLADKKVDDAQSALGEFSYGDSAFSTMFQSIIDRGDLIYVAVQLKPLIDVAPLPGPIYYTSVIMNPIPRGLFPGGFKPYPLSTNGLPTGELSIYSWRYLKGSSTGSLSAFGGIVAYRELRWAGVMLNGMMTGVLFVFLSRWLGSGGPILQVLYLQLFVAHAIKKVPPSFFEAILQVMPLLPVILLAVLLNAVGSRFRYRSRRPLARNDLISNHTTDTDRR